MNNRNNVGLVDDNVGISRYLIWINLMINGGSFGQNKEKPNGKAVYYRK